MNENIPVNEKPSRKNNFKGSGKKVKRDTLKTKSENKLTQTKEVNGKIRRKIKKEHSDSQSKKKQKNKIDKRKNNRKCKRKLRKSNPKRRLKDSKKERKGVVLRGSACQFVDFDAVRTSGKGCQDGTKMVLKNRYVIS